MKYEKANVEVVQFDGQEWLTYSRGKKCGVYGIIVTPDEVRYACYSVSAGFDYFNSYDTAKCSEVDGLIPGKAYEINRIEWRYDQIP